MIKRILLQCDDGRFSSKGDIITVKNSQLAIELIEKQAFDLIICQEWEIFKLVRKIAPQTLVVCVPLVGSIEQAVTAMKMGAFHYISQPLTPDLITDIIHQASCYRCEHRKPLSTHGKQFEQILVESSVMKQVLTDINQVAQSHASVFICGESGTGKEVVAHAIHFQSPRVRRPFVKVNCAAIPESLIESEFFGHEKGSFTGAIERRIGRFELAHLGTLLLDEISEIPLHIQAKLLRVIQEQEFERVGGNKPIKVDVRLIATSNRNMKEMVEKKEFREDLYFRLNVVPIFLPPLRERKEDVLLLAEYFLARFCEENHKNRKILSDSAKKTLLEYPWPGNIRELANVIERSVVMANQERIESEHLRMDPVSPLLSLPPQIMTLLEIEKKHIFEALTHCGQNRTKAARMLGISIRTLRNKIKAYAKQP